MDKLRKAIVVTGFGDPSVLQLKSVPIPSPVVGEVLIKVKAVGVNPVETYIRSGKYARLPSLPYTPGADCAGIVEQVGEGVTHLRPGDPVYTLGANGAYSEYTTAKSSLTFKLPFSPESPQAFGKGACLGVPYFTAYRALHCRGHAKSNETLLVRGATGGVGIACIQMGIAHGMNVFGTAGSPEGKDLLKKFGAHCVLSHDCKEEVLSLTEGKGVNIIVEMLANENLATDLQMLSNNGRVMVVGNRGTVEINPRDTMARESDIRGVMLYAGSEQEFQDAANYIDQGCKSGSLQPTIGKTFPLEHATAAHELVMATTKPGGKIVLIP